MFSLVPSVSVHKDYQQSSPVEPKHEATDIKGILPVEAQLPPRGVKHHADTSDLHFQFQLEQAKDQELNSGRVQIVHFGSGSAEGDQKKSKSLRFIAGLSFGAI